jgi:protein-S-isoprenylcysteine O-methyltransferase Ste14
VFPGWTQKVDPTVTELGKFAVAVLVLLGIAAVFFSPMLDLEPTAVRHLRPVVLLATAMCAGALVMWTTRASSYSRLAAYLRSVPLSPGSLVDLNCVRLC